MRLLNIFILLLIPFSSSGQLKVKAHIAYFKKTELSYSEYVFREITLVPGVILVQKTGNNSYDALKDYVLIRFAQDQVAIIKLKDDLFNNYQRVSFRQVGEDALNLALLGKNKTFDGYDQDNTKWRICFVSEYLKYSCSTDPEPLALLFDGIKEADKLIGNYNRILELSKTGNRSDNCRLYSNELESITQKAKDLKDKLTYQSFSGDDPYWNRYLEFLRTCADIEKSSVDLKRINFG